MKLLLVLIGLLCTNARAKLRRLSLTDPVTIDEKVDSAISAAEAEEKSLFWPRSDENIISDNNEDELLPVAANDTSPPLPAAESSNMNNNPTIPPELNNNLANLSDMYTKFNDEIPFFWHIAKSGGSTIKHMYSDCYGLVEASENGITEGHNNDEVLSVVSLDKTLNGWKFINVDTTLPEGIDRAVKLNFTQSNLALVDLLVSPLPYEVVPKLFDSDQYKGRLFTTFRDPIERAVSLFYYLQQATYEPTYNPALASMTLEEYALSDLVESNFIVRSLINKMEEPELIEDDFLTAKEILKTKCVVGLLTELEESIRRFDSFFEFRMFPPPGKEEISDDCIAGYINKGVNRHSHPHTGILSEDTIAHQELSRKNDMDIRLYKYAIELFEEQAAMFK